MDVPGTSGLLDSFRKLQLAHRFHHYLSRGLRMRGMIEASPVGESYLPRLSRA